MLPKDEMLQRWRNKLFYICVLFAAIGTILEIVIYLYDCNYYELFLSHRLYRFRFIYLPSLANLLIILLTLFCIKSKKFKENTKNTWTCLLIFFLCANMQILHYVYGSLLTLPVIAILVSVMFGNKYLTLMVTILSNISLTIASLFSFQELRKGDQWLTTDVVLAFAIIWIAYISATLLLNFVNEQFNSLILSSKREHSLIEELNLDALTSLQNRKALDDFINDFMENNKDRSDLKAYFIMVDIDNFKRVNDTYGHMAGDEVLVALSSLIRRDSTNDIRGFRYGGDEFTIIMNGFEKEDVLSFMNHLLTEFLNLEFVYLTSENISFSAGISIFKSEMNVEEWRETADKLLYAAKRNGKNQIEIG